MTRPTVRAALAALAASLLLAGCSPAGRPLARVGARTITSADLLEAGRGNESQYPAAPDEAKLALLNDMVRRELLIEAARNRGVDTSRYTRQFVENTTDKLTLEALYRSIAPQDPGVSEAETQRFYEWRANQAAVRIIYSPDRSILEAAMAELERGRPFAEVADRYNMPGTVPPGGAIGMVSPGMLVPPLDRELLTLPPGKVGGPYETPQGLFLMVVDRRVPAERPSYEIAQPQLAELLRQRKGRQAMSKKLVTLRDEYGAKVEKGAAARMFQLMTPARVGDGEMPPLTPEERAEVLARWRGGQFTVGDAFDDLQRSDVQKPPAAMSPAIEQWIESRVITRLARTEAKRRHLAEDPVVARRIRGEYEKYLLDAEFNNSIAEVPPPDEALKREVWQMLRPQFENMQPGVTYETMTPDMRNSVEMNAWQLARDRRLNFYTDSLRTALQPNVYAENLRLVPWPPPATIDVGR